MSVRPVVLPSVRPSHYKYVHVVIHLNSVWILGNFFHFAVLIYLYIYCRCACGAYHQSGFWFIIIYICSFWEIDEICHFFCSIRSLLQYTYFRVESGFITSSRFIFISFWQTLRQIRNCNFAIQKRLLHLNLGKGER